jgi:hypothetical protein
VKEDIATPLAAYREKLRRSFGDDERRVALLQVLRSFDHHFVTSTFFPAVTPEDEARCCRLTDLFAWGLNEALSIMWSDAVRKEGVPLFVTDQALKDWGDSLLCACGRVRLVEHVLELERLRLATISPVVDGAAHCILDCSGVGIEALERADCSVMPGLIARSQDHKRLLQELAARRPGVTERMRRLVKPFASHYIQYDTEPEVDEYYTDLAHAIAPRLFGWDAFPETAIFGGIPYRRYLDAVLMLVGFARKHIDFCMLLCEQNPAISLVDILALPGKWADTCRYLSYGLDLPVDGCEQILATTALTPENAGHHLLVPHAAPAPYYVIGSGSAVKLMAGCLDSPFQFMLREIRRRYPSDWDHSVDDREHVFRTYLIAAFSSFNRIAFFGDSIRIGTDLGETDIDALALDASAGVAALFQLKWQDPFGSSMRERESRKANFLKNGNAWVGKVCRWIGQQKMPQTLASIGVTREWIDGIKETRLFVLGRHFSHFSGECAMDERAAWGTWPQVLRLLETPARGRSPLTIIHDLLKSDSPHKRLPEEIGEQEIKIEGLKVVIRPKKQEAT